LTSRAVIRFLVAAFLLLLTGASGFAYDEAKLKDAERMAILLQAQLKTVASRIDGGTLQDEALAAQRTTLEKLRIAANVGAEKAAGPLEEISTQVNGLGPPPTEGQQETEAISNQRKELNAQLARATAAQKQFVLIGLEVEQAQTRLTNLQRGQFLQRIFKADRSVLNPSLWANTLDGAGILSTRVSNQFARGIEDSAGRHNYAGFLLLPVGLFILGVFLFKLLPGLLARIGVANTTPEDQAPSGLSKLWHVIWNYTKYLLAVLIISVLIAATLDVSGFLTPAIDNLLNIGFAALSPALAYGGLVYFVAAPRNPTYRLLAIDNGVTGTHVVIDGRLGFGLRLFAGSDEYHWF
jgi:small-conductance mechanosensitive channel